MKKYTMPEVELVSLVADVLMASFNIPDSSSDTAVDNVCGLEIENIGNI